MTKEQRRVKEFMQFFGQDCPEKPTQLDEETAILRAKLIMEEVIETICKGLGLCLKIKMPSPNGEIRIVESTMQYATIDFHKVKEVDLVELADGISDIMVVSEGTAVAAGIDMEPIHSEILQSNDSKRWNESDLEIAKVKYPTAKIEKCGELYRLIREDGKVIKSPSYRPANLKPIIKAQLA